MAHKVEQAVDWESGAVVAVTLQPADQGDTATVMETLAEAGEATADVAGETNNAEVGERVKAKGPAEVVLDKGYHSSDTLVDIKKEEARTCCSEPERGRRRWEGKQEEQAAVYANRRRIRGERGEGLLRQRGEKMERSFAHLYETGGLRRVHLRHHPNILKRLLVHVAAFNLGVVMRKVFGKGTPRGLQGCRLELALAFLRPLRVLGAATGASQCPSDDLETSTHRAQSSMRSHSVPAAEAISTTG
jgi:transposase